MAPKTRPLESAKWTLVTVPLAAGTGLLLAATIDSVAQVPSDLYFTLATSFTTFALGFQLKEQLNIISTSRPTQTKPTIQATSARTIPFTQNGRSSNVMMHAVNSIFDQSQPQQPEGQEGLDWWQMDNGVTITQDLAFEFYRKGWNRQMKGENHPFSKGWMTDQKFVNLSYRRLDPVEFEALVILTTVYNLWLRAPQQGRAGRIITNPGGCLARLTGKW